MPNESAMALRRSATVHRKSATSGCMGSPWPLLSSSSKVGDTESGRQLSALTRTSWLLHWEASLASLGSAGISSTQRVMESYQYRCWISLSSSSRNVVLTPTPVASRNRTMPPVAVVVVACPPSPSTAASSSPLPSFSPPSATLASLSSLSVVVIAREVVVVVVVVMPSCSAMASRACLRVHSLDTNTGMASSKAPRAVAAAGAAETAEEAAMSPFSPRVSCICCVLHGRSMAWGSEGGRAGLYLTTFTKIESSSTAGNSAPGKRTSSPTFLYE
mmetsp:Transcript_31402/g.63779  ORF Transcript_31402/g.63779 Transcript_31402/m.63779 type:complete len:274 (+) Transcript_31402:2382-3203(+)